MRGFSYGVTICNRTGGHRKALWVRHRRLRPGVPLPASLAALQPTFPGQLPGVMAWQPASHFGSALEGLAAPQTHRRSCNGEWAGRQEMLGSSAS